MESEGELTATQAKTVLGDMLAAGGGDPAALAADHGFEAMTDDSLAAAVAEVVASHPDEWGRYCEGEDKLTGFFVGRVMKVTGNQADGKAVSAELRKRRG
jgi:aspartyl-tRNA(Asn)/glutamyl-tRNA(Gln) amidotransferase subunit B